MKLILFAFVCWLLGALTVALLAMLKTWHLARRANEVLDARKAKWAWGATLVVMVLLMLIAIAMWA